MSKHVALATLAATVAMAFAAGATAAPPSHDHFVSDPYADGWCGIQGTSVDSVVANYTPDGSRVSLNVKTLFTATASGKSMEIRTTGLEEQSVTVNPDGSSTVLFRNSGQGPGFKLPNGPVLGIDVGFSEGVVTFDANGDFVSFELIKHAGQLPAVCPEIVAALS
jgi:hypothetical protein